MVKIQKARYPRLTKLEALMSGYEITRDMIAKNIGRSYGTVSRYISGITDIPLSDMRLIARFISEITQKQFTIFDVFEKSVE